MLTSDAKPLPFKVGNYFAISVNYFSHSLLMRAFKIITWVGLEGSVHSVIQFLRWDMTVCQTKSLLV